MPGIKENEMQQNDLTKVYLEITEQCNLNCTTCFRQNWTLAPAAMTYDTARLIAKNLCDFPKVKEIVFGGIGEPTSHKQFLLFADLFKNYSLTLTTNACSWSDVIIEGIIEYFNSIVVSVDGLDATFNEIRGFPLYILEDNMKRLRECIVKKKKARPLLNAQLVLSKVNLEEVEILIPRLHKMGFKSLTISNLIPQEEASKDAILYTLNRNPAMKNYYTKWLRICLLHQMQLITVNTYLKSERRCNFTEDGTVFIGSKGDIAPCYRFAHSGTEYIFGRKKEVFAVYYGNLKEHSLRQIWESKVYRDLRNQNYCNRYPSCPDCDFVDHCDYVLNTLCDCNSNTPSCADCLWARGFVECT